MRWWVYILLCTLLSCTTTKESKDEALTPLYTPKYAKSFSIALDSLNRKVLTITNPYQSDKPFEQRVYLLDKEQVAPTSATSIRVPATKISTLSSSHVAMIDAIGAAESIVGVSGVRFLTNKAVRSRATEIGYDSALNFEGIKAAGTDVMLLYGLYGDQSSMTTKLSELGIPYIYIGDYIESSPLGKAEWIVAIAAICGVQRVGEEYFVALEERYNALKQSAAQYTVRPKVMLNTPYNDSWFMPSVRSYAVQLIADAGGEYIYPQNDSAESKPISLEQALLLASTADVWINVGQISSLNQLKSENPKFSTVPAVVNRRVYNNTKRTTESGGSDFWEGGTVNADIVLADMIKLLHCNAPTDSLFYYKRLE